MTSVFHYFYGFLYIFQGVNPLVLKSYTACYGTIGLANFLQPSCATGEKMAVVGLSAVSKELNSSCDMEVTPINVDVIPDSCCQYDPADCTTQYATAVYRNYYRQCNGNRQCTIRVSWVPTPCSHSIYLERTNYMKLDYYCIADQAMDPCSSINTKDNQVFLWSSGYPATSLTGSSSCTCSVEASCDTNIRVTAIDLRLGSTSSCGQSITIKDGATTTVFDCNSNNDYLPTLLHTSSSHFIQMDVVDNQGSAEGYYFLLLEGSSGGSELTLSCSSTATTSPITPATDLTSCPDGSTNPTSTADESTLEYTTTTFKPSERTEKSTLETTNTATITQQTLTSDDEKETTEFTGTTSLNTLTPILDTPGTGSSITETDGSTDTKPTFVSLPSISTEKDVMATSLSTLSFHTLSDITNLFATDLTTELTSSTNKATENTDTSSNVTDVSFEETSSGRTTEKAVSTPETKSSNNSIIIGVAVVVVVLLALILALLWYKDRIKECCCKSKVATKTKGDEEDMYPSYHTIFDENLNIENRKKPHQLPPLQHNVFNRSGTFEKKRKKNKIGKTDTDGPNVGTVNNDTSEPKRKGKKRKKKKQPKGIDANRKPEEIKPVPKLTPSHDKSSFSGTVISMLVNPVGAPRRSSVIDITGPEGNLETTVEVRNNLLQAYPNLRRP